MHRLRRSDHRPTESTVRPRSRFVVAFAVVAAIAFATIGPHPAPVLAASFAPGDGVRVIDGALNVREGPGLDRVVFTVVPDGTAFTIADGPVDASGYTWYAVHSLAITLPLEDNIGWVAGEFLVFDPAVTGCEGQGPCPAPLAPGAGIRVVTDRLNLRAGAGLEAAVLTVILEGTTGLVIDEASFDDGYVWIPIDTDAGDGWVARDFIVADPGAGGAPSFDEGNAVHVIDGALNLRRSPALDAEVIAVMADGTSLTVEDGPVAGDGYTWYEVTSDDYGSGWAAGEFLAAG
jgi:uncharacterized protein YgiM (DUF1202 family)